MNVSNKKEVEIQTNKLPPPKAAPDPFLASSAAADSRIGTLSSKAILKIVNYISIETKE